jgi:hypothetical protein
MEQWSVAHTTVASGHAPKTLQRIHRELLYEQIGLGNIIAVSTLTLSYKVVSAMDKI